MSIPGPLAIDPYDGSVCGWMALPIPAKPESIVTVLGDGVPAPCAPPGAAIIRIVDEDRMTGVYYNDSEPFVCDWLENLIREGLLPAGEVDRRPIQEVSPDDVRGFTQCHFFAGIGGCAYAIQLAGWGDRPVWTGSWLEVTT